MKAHYVLLRAGCLRLVLPQDEVAAAEHAADEQEPPIALSQQMRPLALRPAGRFVLTRVRSGGEERAFAWDEARVLDAAAVQRRPLPDALRGPDSPIDAYAEVDGEIVLCTSAAELLRWTSQ